MKSYTYRVIIEPDGKAFHGYVPALPGCHTHGATIEETREQLRDAMSLYVEHLSEKNNSIPEERGLESFETVTVPEELNV
jgi:predicted RNase H-like HicB family nuclease